MNAKRYVQATADLSINELKVHYLGSTKFVPDAPYAELNAEIQTHTKYVLEIIYRKFYKDAVKVLPILSYKELVEQDKDVMGAVVLPMSMKGIEELQQNYMTKYLRHYVAKRFLQYCDADKTQEMVAFHSDLLGSGVFVRIQSRIKWYREPNRT